MVFPQLPRIDFSAANLNQSQSASLGFFHLGNLFARLGFGGLIDPVATTRRAAPRVNIPTSHHLHTTSTTRKAKGHYFMNQLAGQLILGGIYCSVCCKKYLTKYLGESFNQRILANGTCQNNNPPKLWLGILGIWEKRTRRNWRIFCWMFGIQVKDPSFFS